MLRNPPLPLESRAESPTLIKPRCPLIDRDTKTASRRVGHPDLANRSTLEKVVDGDENVRDRQRGDGAPDQPDVQVLLLRNQAQQEEPDGQAHEVDGKEVRRLRGPEPFEGFGNVGRWHVVDVPTQAEMVGVDEERVCDDHDEL